MNKHKNFKPNKTLLISGMLVVALLFIFVHSSLNIFAGMFLSAYVPNLKAIPILEVALPLDQDGIPEYRSPLHFEGHYDKDPYIDTIFAKDFTPEKFEQIKTGMNKKQVIVLLGEPFTHDSFGIQNPENINEIIMPDDPRAQDCWRYSADGKLRERGDTSWYSFLVCFNDEVVSEKQANEFND